MVLLVSEGHLKMIILWKEIERGMQHQLSLLKTQSFHPFYVYVLFSQLLIIAIVV